MSNTQIRQSKTFISTADKLFTKEKGELVMFGKKTQVPAAKSALEIKKIVSKFGCRNFRFGSKTQQAYITFTFKNVPISINFNLPPLPDKNGTTAEKNRYEQIVNTKWRQILFCIKAKITAVGLGLETFEEAFTAHIGRREETKSA